MPGRLGELGSLLAHMARTSGLHFEDPPADAFRDVVAGIAIGMKLPQQAGATDGARVEKALGDLDEEITSLAAKLRNPSYVEKAPGPVVEKTRRRLLELEERRAALAGGRS
jgi:valyl-tRNA synthetase